MRRRRDQEDTPNQRYSESKEKRSKEDKEIQNKYTEKEVSTKEDKLTPCAAAKAKPVRAAVDLGREKLLRTPTEKWKRQDDRDSREKRCFICGREGHIKKECPQFKGSPGTDNSPETVMFMVKGYKRSRGFSHFVSVSLRTVV